MKKVIVKKNRYVDSVSLMGVSERVTAMEGIVAKYSELPESDRAYIAILYDEYAKIYEACLTSTMPSITDESRAYFEELDKVLNTYFSVYRLITNPETLSAAPRF